MKLLAPTKKNSVKFLPYSEVNTFWNWVSFLLIFLSFFLYLSPEETYRHRVEVDGQKISLEILDTAGQVSVIVLK